MEQIVLVLHLLVALALIGVVLLQRSEGGALGIGGGGSGGGLISGRSAANILTRMTTILAATFMCTSLLLAVLAGQDQFDDSILEDLQSPVQTGPSVPLSE